MTEVLPALGKDFPRPSNEIANSEQCHAIYVMLRSGWHPEAVSLVIRRQFGVHFTPQQIGQYLREIPTQQLTPRALALYFDNQDFVVDTLGDMHKLVVMTEQKLVDLIRLEAPETPLSHQVLVLTKETFRMLKELTELEQLMGVNRYSNQAVLEPGTAATVDTVEQILRRTRISHESHDH